MDFKVQDNGRGVYTNDLPFVFERYFQSNQTEAVLEGGSGIGLAICKEFIELMGGEIKVHSKIEEGSTFSFSIPLEIEKEDATLPIKQLQKNNANVFFQKTSKTYFSKEKQTILIVEDHQELKHHLKNILSKNYNIIVASNGEEALNILEKTLPPDSSHLFPHLILSDVMMPKMDGFTFLEKVKAHEQFCGIPFILLTARADIQNKLQGLRIGVDAYMTKPFELEELLIRVKNLLGNVQNRQFEITEIASATKKESIYQPTKADIAWLKEMETIALREIQNKNFVMEDLAKELLISYSSFRRKVKQITGLSPNRYIRSIRLHQAKYILESQEVKTLKGVAFAVGFDGLTHFNKLFETEFGKRPHAYLEEQEI